MNGKRGGSRKQREVEIRSGPIDQRGWGLEYSEKPFTVVIVTRPRGPGEPGDPRHPGWGARPMESFDTFDRACQAAAKYAIPADYRVRRLRERLKTLEAAVYQSEVAAFTQRGPQ